MNNQFKYGFLGITSLLFCGACVTKQNEQLNILFITADDLGMSHWGSQVILLLIFLLILTVWLQSQCNSVMPL